MQKICDFNFNQELRGQVQVLRPLDINNLKIDVAINKWGTAAKARLPQIRQMLTPEHKF
jgi:hypothetical protein